MSKYVLFMSNRGPHKEQKIFMSGHKSKSQKMDLNYVRTQVKIAKDRFDLCPDTSQNRKIWQLRLMDKFVLYDKIKAYSSKNILKVSLGYFLFPGEASELASHFTHTKF